MSEQSEFLEWRQRALDAEQQLAAEKERTGLVAAQALREAAKICKEHCVTITSGTLAIPIHSVGSYYAELIVKLTPAAIDNAKKPAA